MAKTATAAPQPLRLERTIDSVPYVTGLCMTGAHETSQVRHKCKGEYVFRMGRFNTAEIVCSCECHSFLREAREMIARARAAEEEELVSSIINAPRVPKQRVENDLLGFDIHAFRGFDGPQQTDAPMSTPAPAKETPPVDLMPLLLVPVAVAPTPAPPPPVLVRHSSAPHPRRGHLEERVRELVLRWQSNEDLLGLQYLTTREVSETLAATGDGTKPSQGAIYAIFQRWEKAGLVELGTKPFRLVRVARPL